MQVLFDTQVLLAVGVAGVDVLPAKIRKLMMDPETERIVSAVSITEIAIKASVGRLVMARNSVSQLLADLKTTIIPFKPSHAMRLFDLPLHHTDPFDRMLIATALTEKLPLVGGDEYFPAYKPEGLQVIWK